MALLPTDTRTKTEQLIEDVVVYQEPRPYLGISAIAIKCPRELWYAFRLVSLVSHSSRMERLFQRGHREEKIIQADLRKIGIHHHSDQFEVTYGNGHIKGHIDDLLENVPDAPKTTHLGEYKTHNDKSFKDLKTKGVGCSKPVHYGQMICYMHLLKLKRGFYIGVNKNDDERHYERISDNPQKAKFYLDRGVDIISTETPPARIGGSTWHECKWCDHYQVCQFNAKPLKNCRTCKFADIIDDGTWYCSGYKLILHFSLQKMGCEKHRWMEGLKKC